MKPKTARRFMRRNAYRMAQHKTGVRYQKKSFLKRWKTCTEVLIKEP